VLVVQRGNVVIVYNLSGRSFATYGIGIPSAGVWQVRLNTDLKVYSSQFGDVGRGITSVTATSPGIWGQAAQVNVALGAYTAVILSQ
jgi:1,4-alpha-glucan branching enzyme